MQAVLLLGIVSIAVTLFLAGINVYKSEMRRAYIVLSIGLLCFALAVAQLPIIGALNLWDTIWLNDGIVGIPFLLAGIIAYIGMRRLALLTGQRVWLTRPWAVVLTTLVLSVVLINLPHVMVAYPETSFDIGYGGVLPASVVFSMAAGLLALHVKRHIGSHYTVAMTWLYRGLVVNSIAIAVSVMAAYFSATAVDYWNVASYGTGILGGALLIVAGYMFVKTKEY
jgi:hypothetical protein